MYTTLIPATHVSAQTDLMSGLLTVVTAIAVLCGSLVVLAYLEPKKTRGISTQIQLPPRRPSATERRRATPASPVVPVPLPRERP